MASHIWVTGWWESLGANRAALNLDGREVWREIARGTLAAWRYHHPEEKMVFLDLDGLFTDDERGPFLARLNIVDGRKQYPPADAKVWSRTYLDKISIMAGTDAISVTWLDLDVLSLGHMGTGQGLGGPTCQMLSFPRYVRNRSGMCSCLWTVHGQGYFRAWWQAAAVHAARVAQRGGTVQEQFCDEAISTFLGEMVPQLAPIAIDTRPEGLIGGYAVDPRVWVLSGQPGCDAKFGGPLHQIDRPRSYVSDARGLVIENGGHPVQSVHLTGIRGEVICDPRWAQYREWLARHLCG